MHSKHNKTDELTISVVMSVWNGDNAIDLGLAIESVLNQTKEPHEIIILKDGPVNKAIDQCLDEFAKNPKVKILSLAKNKGRGYARNHAISHAIGDVIFMMDADDISRVDRIEKQINTFLENDFDLLGGYIEEFDKTPGDAGEIREVPLDATNIKKMARYRSPFNHVTLMYRTEFFRKLGGYSDLRYVEDWDLYLRAVHAKGSFGNIPETLVDVRKAIWRRRSLGYFLEEKKILGDAFKRGQISLLVLIISLGVRGLKLIAPAFAIHFIYRTMLRQKIR